MSPLSMIIRKACQIYSSKFHVICKYVTLLIYDLWGYDTTKPVDEISLNFPELFIIEKNVIIRFKNRESPCYFLS